jgi:hypothetical protein
VAYVAEVCVLRLVLAVVALVVAEPGFAKDYRLGVGDSVTIQVYNEPLFSGVTPITSACRIDVKLIGAVDVCGRSTDEIATDVATRLAGGFLVDPYVIVEVATYGSQDDVVEGEVLEQDGADVISTLSKFNRGADLAVIKSVAVPLHEGLTVSEAVSMAKETGFSARSRKRHIRRARPGR